MSDATARELVWSGKLPLEIHLDDPEGILSEKTSKNGSKGLQHPFYIMARRMTYLSLLVNEIKRHFAGISQSSSRSSELLASTTSEGVGMRQSTASFGRSSESHSDSYNMVFSCQLDGERIVLPWHLPIGLAFDLIKWTFSSEASLQTLLPWQLTFHLSITNGSDSSIVHHSFPLLPIITWPSQALDDQTTALFFSALKEADYLRCGSSKNVMNLSRTEQLQLWESLKSGNFERFWRINNKLLAQASVLKGLPIRIWLLQPRHRSLQRFQFQAPSCGSVNDLLKSEFPDCTSLTVVCQGIVLPLECDLTALSINCAYADNFLHLLVISNQ